MKRSERLQVIIDIQMLQEKQALEALGICRQQQQALMQQLKNLQAYRQEYQEKYGAFNSPGMTINQLMEFRAFISKLDAAIDAQQQMVAAKDKELMVYRKTWEQKHQKTKGLQKAGETAAKEEIRLEAKREQTEQDDWASRSCRKSGIENA